MAPLERLREWLTRLVGTFRRSPTDRDLEKELAFHLEMEEQKLRGRGHAPKEAARLARVHAGRVPQVMDTLREQRSVPWLGRFTLDFVLALRMLRKSWGLTVIGGLAMTIAITIAAGAFSFMRSLSGGPVPLDEGDRVVAIQTWSQAAGRSFSTAREDLARWSDALQSLQDVGAFRTVSRGFAFAEDAPAAAGSEVAAGPIAVAEMSAAGFRLARVPPQRGRLLVEGDEREGAEPVVVIGYGVWQSRFAASADVIGRRMRLDGIAHTIVGVMPEGFAFPINHSYWVALKANAASPGWNDGPEIMTFARLAPGATLERAQAEVVALGLLARAPGTMVSETLDPQIVPYAQAFIYVAPGWYEVIILLLSLLLVPPCANIAILVYARTITRQHEFATRFALGASRGRIVAQLFVEMLVLSAIAAAAALVLVQVILPSVQIGTSQSPGATPFWMELGVSSALMLYVAGLATAAAFIAGVVPALQATGRLAISSLRTLGGGAGLRLGRNWTALVVVQVAIAVIVLPFALELGWGLLRPGVLGPGFAAGQFMTARLRYFGPDTDRIANVHAELARRLEAEPGVSAVALSEVVPGGERSRRELLLENAAASAAAGDSRRAPPRFMVAVNRIDGAFFDVFDAPVLAGRGFRVGDFEPGSDAVLINRTFADEIGFTQGNPLGLRVRDRFAQPAGAERRYEIVGVIRDLPENDDTARMYHPMAPGPAYPVTLAMRVGAGAGNVAGSLQRVARDLDSAFVVDEVRPLDFVYLERRLEESSMAVVLGIATLSVLLLSAAGMYALMSFTVNQRRREIGIRAALGAPPGRLVAGVLRRAIAQVAAGAGAGLVIAFALGRYVPLEDLGAHDVPYVLAFAAAFMIVLGLAAAAGPARRAIGVAPTHALREDG